MLRIKAAEGISENDRERDTFKYDPTLIDGVAFNDTSKPLNSSQLFTANDTVLTSLAQLGAIRTRTSRSLISLFDQHWQYIIAEATPNLPLLPNISQAELEGEHLWLSRTAIPRVHGVCKHTLVDPGSIDDPEDELPLTVTNDLTMDSRFCKKPYCMPGSSARFYAAVPIRTPGGINIGVYCVIDETPKPISSWTGKHTAVLRHISRAIMSHIDFRSTKNTQRVNERMTRGIASFMEADFDTATLHPLVDPNLAGYQRKVVLPLNSSQLDLPGYPVVEVDQPILHVQSHLLTQRTNASFQGLSALERSEQQTPDNRPGLNRSSRSYTSNSSSSSSEQSTDLNSSTITKCIFNTAANIVRESIECDGMFFFNANAVGLDVPFEPLQRFPASSDGSTVNADAEDNDIDCPTLGSSMSSLSSSTTDAVSTHDIKMPAKLLSTLFRRYPTGNIFVFDEYGTIQNNEPLGDSDSSMLPIPPATDTKPQPARQFSNSRSRSIVAEVLSKCFPGARSVVFAPVRDDLKERWFAGGFAYTTKPTRVFTIPGELSYARAFSTLIMAEVHRMEITLAHRAKSDILNSLSHELRSPLHGVILSTELLADTALDVYQGNILHTLETCGRTLLDTVDHLLDYSKINNFLKSAKAEKRAARGRRSQVATPIEAGMKNLYSNVCLDVLVEEVVESVFAGHQFQHMSVAQLTRRHSLHADTGANRHADSARGIEDLGLSLNDKGELQLLLDRVSVYLDIDANVSSFQFSSMAGALRRVIMNLFGNALQYTNDGKIHIALSIDPETNESTRDDYRVTRLTIMDTGRGMSADFIQNDLYRPFRQADQLSAGIGLGLSLVKKIVSSLKGKISITSQLGVGTVVTVLLPLPFVSIPCTVDPVEQHECREIDDHRSKLKGLRVRLAGFKANDAAAASMLGCHQRAGLEFSIDKICREWLQMETLTQSCSNYLAPDVIICPEASLDELCQGQELSSIPPVVAICTNAIVARDRSLNTGGAYRQRIYEFISQPQVFPVIKTR